MNTTPECFCSYKNTKKIVSKLWLKLLLIIIPIVGIISLIPEFGIFKIINDTLEKYIDTLYYMIKTYIDSLKSVPQKEPDITPPIPTKISQIPTNQPSKDYYNFNLKH